MNRGWKAPHIIKGVATWIPGLYAWRLRHALVADSQSPRYCYSVWLRHLVTLSLFGFGINGAEVGEFGPGNSLGVGLAALLSGASLYIALDVIPFAAKSDLKRVFDELLQMYSRREPIPNNDEFPSLLPRLDSYEFPDHLVDWTSYDDKSEKISSDLTTDDIGSRLVNYITPWTSPDVIAASSLDLIFSQSVLEHVDALEETYRAMFRWLRSGGYASHVIDFGSHHLSPMWNGHWTYSDLEWRLVRGGRRFLLNREALSTHITCAEKVGFKVLLVKREYDDSGFNRQALSQRYSGLEDEDVRTRSAMLILRKP